MFLRVLAVALAIGVSVPLSASPVEGPQNQGSPWAGWFGTPDGIRTMGLAANIDGDLREPDLQSALAELAARQVPRSLFPLELIDGGLLPAGVIDRFLRDQYVLSTPLDRNPDRWGAGDASSPWMLRLTRSDIELMGLAGPGDQFAASETKTAAGAAPALFAEASPDFASSHFIFTGAAETGLRVWSKDFVRSNIAVVPEVSPLTLLCLASLVGVTPLLQRLRRQF